MSEKALKEEKEKITIYHKNEVTTEIEFDRDLARNKGECKELCSNRVILWFEIPIFFTAIRVNGKVYCATECNYPKHFAPEILRFSFRSFLRFSPYAAVAYGGKDNNFSARIEYY